MPTIPTGTVDDPVHVNLAAGEGGADASAANQALQIMQETALNAAIGTTADAAAANDTATATITSFAKRLQQRFTALLGILPSDLTGGGNFKTAVAEALPAGTNIIGVSGVDQTTPGTTDSVTVKASAGIGALTEASPATDTASSGLNGRLQRIAQRITSLIGYFLPITTATLSNVSASVTSVTLLAGNASRRRVVIVNDSTSKLYVKFGATASASSYTYLLAAGDTYESPVLDKYTGVIDGIWVSANGAARITECV